jgi:hypothetical protein
MRAEARGVRSTRVVNVRFTPKSGHRSRRRELSALCQKRTSEKLLNYLVGAGEKGRANQSDQHPWLHHGCTLAADIKRCDLNVGFVPIANIGANLKVYLVRWRRQTAGERVHPLM